MPASIPEQAIDYTLGFAFPLMVGLWAQACLANPLFQLYQYRKS